MTTTQKIKEEWKKAFVGKTIYDVEIDGEHLQLIEVGDALLELESHLLKQREELIKEIEGMKHNHFKRPMDDEHRFFYNQAIDDIINLLTQSKGGKI